MREIFSKNIPGMTEKLSKAVIGIAGCGGIGSNAAVSLVRSGIGRLIIADFDRIEESNLNRQYYFYNEIGELKAESLEKRLKKIYPDCNIKTYIKKLNRQDIPEIFGEADILIEAFDRSESKQWLIEEWSSLYPDKPVISGNGLAGAGNFEKLYIRNAGNIWFCGDGESDMEIGLTAARVNIVANMQADLAVELLIKDTGRQK